MKSKLTSQDLTRMHYQKPKSNFTSSQISKAKELQGILDDADEDLRLSLEIHNKLVKIDKEDKREIFGLAKAQKQIDLENQERLATIAENYKKKIEL